VARRSPRTGPAVVVVGEALVDLVVAGDGVVAATPGGAPFNVARACARLGAPVGLIAAVSIDQFGRRLMADLSRDGVDTAQVQRTEAPTTLAVADLDDVGGASYRFYLQGTSAAGLAAVPLPAATRAVVAGGLGLAVEPMASAVERMLLDAGDDVLVLVDLNSRPDAVADRGRYLERLRRILGRADIVKASVEDLCYTDPATEPAAAAALLVTGRTQAVLLTAGAAPTTIVTAAGTRTVPVPVTASPVVDTIGAGDSFTAGFLTWWTASTRAIDDLTDIAAVAAAVHAAHQAAAVVVGRRGADPPHRRDLPLDWGRGVP
jgi:fructokinase